MIRNILPKGVECIFVRQAEQLGLGHAILCAERAIGHEPFAVLLADDFLPNDGRNATMDLISSYEKSKKNQLSVIQVDGSDISKYGVIKKGKKLGEVLGLVEKPRFNDAPSNLASIGRYILTEDIFASLQNLLPGKNDEIQLADAINEQAIINNVQSVLLNGSRFDCGQHARLYKCSNTCS
jgi:UTP--glucose-1-phosphate uridylyltransferase